MILRRFKYSLKLLLAIPLVMALLWHFTSTIGHKYRPEIQSPEFEEICRAHNIRNVYRVLEGIYVVGKRSVIDVPDELYVVFINPSYSPYLALIQDDIFTSSRYFRGKIAFYIQNTEEYDRLNDELASEGVYYNENVTLLIKNNTVIEYIPGLAESDAIVNMISRHIPFYYKL